MPEPANPNHTDDAVPQVSYVADVVIDETTGETVHLTADSAAALDQKIDDLLDPTQDDGQAPA